MFKWPQGSHVDRAIERRCKVWYRKWRYGLKQKAYADFATVDDHCTNPLKKVEPEQWKWLVNDWDTDKFRIRSRTLFDCTFSMHLNIDYDYVFLA